MDDGAIPRFDRRTLLGAAASVLLSPGFGSAREVSSESSIRFGLTPVFLTSDLELLGRLQAYLQRATGRSRRPDHAAYLSGNHDPSWCRGNWMRRGFAVTHSSRTEASFSSSRCRCGTKSRFINLTSSSIAIDRPKASTDLRGDIHAFSDPDSNSGFLVTRAALAEQGLRPETFFSRTFYTYGHRNVIRAVAAGLAGSGSVDGYVYDVVAELEPELTTGIRILRRSEWLGFPPIAAPRIAVDERRLAALTAALLQMGNDPDGRAALSMLRLDGSAIEPPALFDPIAVKAALVAASG